MLEAAAIDGVDIEWRVGCGSRIYDDGLAGLVELMEQCLESDASKRPLLTAVQRWLQATVRR